MKKNFKLAADLAKNVVQIYSLDLLNFLSQKPIQLKHQTCQRTETIRGSSNSAEAKFPSKAGDRTVKPLWRSGGRVSYAAAAAQRQGRSSSIRLIL